MHCDSGYWIQVLPKSLIFDWLRPFAILHDKTWNTVLEVNGE